MNLIYTVSQYKVFSETIGNDDAHGFNAFEIENVSVNGEKMTVYFCRNEKGMFAIAGCYRKGPAYRSCGHWHSGRGYCDVYFRKNFKNRDEGNAFYKEVKRTLTITV